MSASIEDEPPPRKDGPVEDFQGPESGSPPEQPSDLRNALDVLRSEVAHLTDRIRLIERMLAVPEIDPAPARAVTPGAALPQTQPASRTPPLSTTAPPVPQRSYFAVPAGGGISGIREKIFGRAENWDWEWLFGGNWLARIGIVAVIVGVAFFLKLAFDNDWIGETGRVVLGLAGGIALLAAGEFWRRKYPVWAQPLTGGGLAVLYLAIYAAQALYGLIPPGPALGFFFLVTLTSAALALRYESAAIAVLGILGGFATPLLLADRLADQRLLLAYVLVLDLGVLALATFRNWRWFTLLGLVGSVVLFQFWLEELDPGLLLSMVGATIIFGIFVGATTLFHLLWRRTPGPADQALMLLTAAAYFGISYQLMFDELRDWMGGFTLLLALFYGLLGYGVVLRHREQAAHSLFALGIAVVFLTIAVPVQLDGPWISVAWAVEGVVLVWLSFVLGMPQIRWFGLVAFAISVIWLFAVDTRHAADADLRPFLNLYSITYAVAIGASYLAAYLFHRNRERLLDWEQRVFSGFVVLGSLILTLAVPLQAHGPWLAVVWAVEGLVLLLLSFRMRLIELRAFSLGVFAIVLVRLLAFDTANVDREQFRPIINERFLSFAVGIVSIYLGAGALWRWRERYVNHLEKYLFPIFLAAANFVTLWILSAEIIASVDSEYFGVSRDIAANVTSLSLSILWAVYAVILVVVGIVGRWRWVRVAGLTLLAVPILKLFLYDTFSLEREYRVVAYLGLGILLVAGGFLYQRYSRVIREFLLE